ncbi:MAG TPA: cation:proton antiporter, partial [Dehalococcoidia bacterium]|nr:cation:proton antiporter [Dehalococcoidia bacterium]
LLAVRSVAVPGAAGQIAVATSLGTGLALTWGWNLDEAVILGMAISVASTVVLLRALEDRGTLTSVHGRVAVGWLIVEDLFTVVALVLLPAIAASGQTEGLAAELGGGSSIAVVALSLASAGVFIALMLIVGSRVIPWLLVRVARLGSRELFTLAVMAVAVGIAVGSAELFGASLALGAFLAGLIISESDVSHRAASEALPMRDAFAVLFFVSVGMLFDPEVLVDVPLRVLSVLGIVVIAKGAAALTIVVLLRNSLRTGLTVAAGLAQVGEFSFILAALGSELDVFPDQGTDLILAAALLSIALNPLLFRLIDPAESWLGSSPFFGRFAREGTAETLAGASDIETLRNHAVLVGYGRVGRIIARVLDTRGFTSLVIDQDRRTVEMLRGRGVPSLYGDAGREAILEHAQLATARVLIVAIGDAPTTRRIVEYASEQHPRLDIVVRTHSESERSFLQSIGVGEAVFGEWETALEMTRRALHRFGLSRGETQAIVQALRTRGRLPGV